MPEWPDPWMAWRVAYVDSILVHICFCFVWFIYYVMRRCFSWFS